VSKHVDEALVDEGRLHLQEALPEAIGVLRQAGLGEREIRDLVEGEIPDAADEPPRLCGLPIDDVQILTFDGHIWIEILGVIRREVRPGGAVVLTMKIAQVPGGKSRKYGLSPGDTITFVASRVVAVGSQNDRVSF
jgi:hypothetical protein